MQLRLGRAGTGAHDGGDLRVRVALDRVQHEDGSGSVGQGGDRSIQVEACIDLGLRSLNLFGSRGALLAEDSALVRAPLTQHGVDGQSVQPGPKRGIPAKAVEPLPGADEDLLGSRLSVVVVPTR